MMLSTQMLVGVGASCDGGRGVCQIDADACAGTYETGLCPGPPAVRCCTSQGGVCYGSVRMYSAHMIVEPANLKCWLQCADNYKHYTGLTWVLRAALIVSRA